MEPKLNSSNVKHQVSSMSLRPLIAIVGETASGKTAASIKIAQKVGGEIICADSRTVYRQMDVGTAKPTKEDQLRVSHHLIDVVDVNEKFSVADFQRLARKCIQEIHGRGNIPIIVGGSGLYIDSLLYNYQLNSKADDVYRAQLEQMNDEELTTLLHTKNIDLTTLNTKNRRHVIRAIERGEAPPRNTKLRENTFVVGLRLDREVLKARIVARVDQMLADGFIEETQSLSDAYGWDAGALSGAGYMAARQYLEGAASLEDVRSALIRRDLSLAKRQRTWFKRNVHIEWFESPGDMIARANNFVKNN